MVGAENPNAGHHVVQFYGDDGELAERVTSYLLEAVEAGGAAIVIATADHRRDFEARMEKAGVDLAAARDAGAYRAMDARETVREFTVGGRLDPAAFDRVIGGLIGRAGAGGRPVRAYGEMVALLWDDGLVNDAIELEEMWNELGRRHPFSVFCGYRADSVTGDGYLDAFAQVCRLHGEIVGTAAGAPGRPAREATRAFALSRQAPAEARHFAVDALLRQGAADFADDVALVVTELAANAVLHARSAFTVVIAYEEGAVRVSVSDATPLPAVGAAQALPPVPLHGLGAVAALASQWGVEPLGAMGKTVWVELRR